MRMGNTLRDGAAGQPITDTLDDEQHGRTGSRTPVVKRRKQPAIAPAQSCTTDTDR